MTQPLSYFISSVRSANSIEDARFTIATEQAQIRAYLRKMDPDMRPRVISKLVFLDMLGENVSWGQMDALTLMSYDRFSFKRVGYICAGVLLDSTNDLTVLVTQTLLKDLESRDRNVVCLALDFIANLGNAEVCRDVANAVKRHLEVSSNRIMKKAGMATVTIIRKNPDLAEGYKNCVQSLLNSNVHGTVNAGINLVLTMLQAESKLVKAWAQFCEPFTKILKTLTTNRALKEFSFGVYNDPFMQVKCLKALGMLKKNNDELEGILQNLVSSLETKRNSGRSILYQTVETICALSTKTSLRGLAFTQIGRLLSMRDPNVLYSSLSVFARVLYEESANGTRGSAESMALQRYRTQITKCLDHNDPSIRRRALDVISALIDANNAETLVPEILAYLKLADADFRSELVTKIYSATQKYAPSELWNFDTVHQILIDSGNYVSQEIISSFCALIAKTPSLHQHAVDRLSESLVSFSDNQTLMQVAAFIIGEYATVDNDALISLSHILTLPQTKPETKLYIITAISKMSTRFGKRDQVMEILRNQVTSNNLEVQQRAGEMLKLLSHPEVCEEMLAPIEEAGTVPQASAAPQVVSNKQKNLISTILLEFDDDPAPTQPTQAATPAQPLHDPLLDLDIQTPAAPTQTQQTLLDALGAAPRPAAPAPAQPATLTELGRQSDYIIYGEAKGNPADPRQVALRLEIRGTGSTQLTEFKVEYQVPAGWKINVQPAAMRVLAPAGGQPFSQLVYLMNSANAPFQMRMKISYKFGMQPINEAVVINVMPPIQ